MERSFTLKTCILPILGFLLCIVIMKPAMAGSYEAVVARFQKITNEHDDLMDRLGTRINPTCDSCHAVYDQIDEKYNAYLLQYATLVPQSSGRLTQTQLAENLNRFVTQVEEYNNKIVREYDLGNLGTLCGKCIARKPNYDSLAMDHLQALIDEFGSREKAAAIQNAYGQAIKSLSAAIKAFEKALDDPDYKKLIDELFRRFNHISGNIPRELYEHYLDRMKSTLAGLTLREQFSDMNIKNPYTFPNATIQDRAKRDGVYAFILLDHPEHYIFIQNGFFKLKGNEQATIIIHEQSHVSVGTKDIGAYGYLENRLLKNHKEAFSNADSFAYLVWDLANNAPR